MRDPIVDAATENPLRFADQLPYGRRVVREQKLTLINSLT